MVNWIFVILAPFVVGCAYAIREGRRNLAAWKRYFH